MCFLALLTVALWLTVLCPIYDILRAPKKVYWLKPYWPLLIAFGKPFFKTCIKSLLSQTWWGILVILFLDMPRTPGSRRWWMPNKQFSEKVLWDDSPIALILVYIICWNNVCCRVVCTTIKYWYILLEVRKEEVVFSFYISLGGLVVANDSFSSLLVGGHY